MKGKPAIAKLNYINFIDATSNLHDIRETSNTLINYTNNKILLNFNEILITSNKLNEKIDDTSNQLITYINLYDILTNKTYGLSIPEENIDKYRFYQIAQYCDACDATTGNFVGVDGLSDGTFKYKPRNTFTSIIEKLLGLPQGTEVKERRFILDVLISDQSQSFDTINTLAASFRS